jgi:hypothetical protein
VEYLELQRSETRIAIDWLDVPEYFATFHGACSQPLPLGLTVQLATVPTMRWNAYPSVDVLPILEACAYSPAMQCHFETMGGREEEVRDFETTLECMELNRLLNCGNAAWMDALLDGEVASFAVHRGGPSAKEMHVAFKPRSKKYKMQDFMRASTQKRQAAKFRRLYGFCENSLWDEDFRSVGAYAMKFGFVGWNSDRN